MEVYVSYLLDMLSGKYAEYTVKFRHSCEDLHKEFGRDVFLDEYPWIVQSVPKYIEDLVIYLDLYEVENAEPLFFTDAAVEHLCESFRDDTGYSEESREYVLFEHMFNLAVEAIEWFTSPAFVRWINYAPMDTPEEQMTQGVLLASLDIIKDHCEEIRSAIEVSRR